jgi:hypothetical protein
MSAPAYSCMFRRFAQEASECRAIRVVASEAIRWPLVHSDDLAALFALALERAPAGSNYIGAVSRAVRSGRSHAPSQRDAADRDTPRSSPRTRSRPSLVNGPAAMRSISSSAVKGHGANSAGARRISIPWRRPQRSPESKSPPQVSGPSSDCQLGQRETRSARNLERAKGLEPSTPTLARSCSTTELHPHPRWRRSLADNGRPMPNALHECNTRARSEAFEIARIS